MNIDDLQNAIQQKNLKKIREIVEKTPDIINEKNLSGKTALHIIAESLGDDVEVAKYLIANGADKGIKDNQGWTAFDWADFLTNVQICELLDSKTET